jgi:hypothetical protein
VVDEYEQELLALQRAMESGARPAFDDNEIEHLRVLIRLTVDFSHYLRSTPPWPQFPEDPAHDREYKIDSIFFNIDSFRTVMRLYGTLDGAVPTAIDWTALSLGVVTDEFLRVYAQLGDATGFETQCRLLLDLLKLQLVFAGAFSESIR